MEFPEQLVYWITMISTVIDLVYENLIILIFSKKKKKCFVFLIEWDKHFLPPGHEFKS